MKKLFTLALLALSFNASAGCLVAGDYRTADGNINRIVLTNKGTYVAQSITVADSLAPMVKTEYTGTYKVYPGCFAILTRDNKDDDHHNKPDKPKSIFIAFSDFGKLKDGRPIANVGLSDKFTMVRTFKK